MSNKSKMGRANTNLASYSEWQFFSNIFSKSAIRLICPFHFLSIYICIGCHEKLRDSWKPASGGGKEKEEGG